jgi:hypothetical protein
MRALASIAAMKELLVQALPYLPVTLLALTLVLLAPYVGEVGRRRIVLFFAVAAIGLIVLGVRSAGTEVKLDVVNPFPVDSNWKPQTLHIETVTASGWQWPIAAAAFCGFVALLVFGSMRMSQGAPKPAFYCALVATAFLGLRLVLEKNAAPQGVVQAIGASIGLPILVAFVGFYSAGRKQGFGRFLLSVLVFALMQRAILTAFAYFATMRHWGTHLDMNVVTQLGTPGGGERHFGANDAAGKWFWAIVIPQMVLWVAITFVLGLVAGTAGWFVGRRR